MRRRLADVAFGVRIATASRTTVMRTAFTALGVALGVCVLLVAASVPHAFAARAARERAATPVALGMAARLHLLAELTVFDGTTISENAVRVTRGRGAVARPPGVARLPGPGEMVVSPEVLALLRAPGGGELRRRLSARIVGMVGRAGLAEPGDAVLYRGDAAPLDELSTPVARFGGPLGSGDELPLITLLTIVIVVALLLPVAVFVATAARFGAEERDRRLAAMRLVGADRAAVTRIAAGESLLGATIGLVLGAAGFVVLRPLAARAGVAGFAVFTGDLRPSSGLVALVVILVPLSAVAATLASIRRVAIEPLGLTRRAARSRRRLLWRLAAPALGFALLAALVAFSSRLSSTAGQVEATAGVILVLLGVTALLPWLVEAVARRAPDGPLPWLLAVRQLRHEEGTTGRVIGAIGLAVAGAVALSVVFNAAQNDVRAPISPTLARTVYVQLWSATRAGARRDLATLRAVPGVSGEHGGTNPEGRAVAVSAEILLAPDSLAARGAATARLRDAAAVLDPLAQVTAAATRDSETRTFDHLRRALLAGALIVLAMIGASLLVATGEGLRDRRPALAVLGALGTRRATVAWSILWQAAIPVVAGLVLALGLGMALGAMLTAVVRLPLTYDWGGIALMLGAGAAVIAAVTGLTLPALGRAMEPKALRVE